MAVTAPQTIIDRLIEIDKLLKPLEEEKEKLKIELRQFGPAAYNGADGFVTVASPSIRTKKGEQYILNEANFLAMTVAARKKLIDKGVVLLETLWSRAAVAKVDIKVTGK